jgi:hypothetical protein
MRAIKTSCLVVVWACLGLSSAWAHKGSDAYLDVQEVVMPPSASSQAERNLRDYQLQFAVAVKDLDLILPLDANADGQVTWGEIRAATPLVIASLNSAARLEVVSGPSSCALHWQYDGVERRSDGAYLRFASQALCSMEQGLTLRYTLFKNQDASHRLLVAGRVGGQDLLSTATPQQAGGIVLVKAGAVTSSDSFSQQKQASAGRWSSLVDYFSVGMHHLLEGYDHLAFLLALVLPMQLRFGALLSFRRHASVDPLTLQRKVWMDLFRTITAFTVGHSVTLIIATLGWLQASPVWVEPMIALSIIVTALLNLRPVAWVRTDVLALMFGLIHGFGFAGLLQEAAVPTGLLPWALAGFNGGIEIGQLLVVSVWVLLSQTMVRWSGYERVVVRGGSVALALLASWWFLQRVS